jgi:carboxymethylenebutenolidase
MLHEVTTSETSFNLDDGTVATYVAKPVGIGPFPGLMVFHEAFGLNDDIRRIANRFFKQRLCRGCP